MDKAELLEIKKSIEESFLWEVLSLQEKVEAIEYTLREIGGEERDIEELVGEVYKGS